MRPHSVRRRPLPLLRLLALIAVAVGMIAVVLLPASAAHADDVNDFSYSSWDSDYRVSLDASGHAVAHVTETLVADFPRTDQNKGIIRGYPQRYEGAGLSIRIVSVKDAKGHDVPFETDTEDGYLLVETGDDSYVHGPTTYVIESTMRDFMIHGAETGNDEFYWNLLPLDSTQAIGRFHASITFSPQLAERLTGDVACYSGLAGQRKPCTVAGPADAADGTVFTIESGRRAAGDGVTAAIGFAAGTVTQPDARGADPAADFGPSVVGLGAVGASVGAWVSIAALARKRRKATGIIVAQYDVPGDLPPLVAAALLPNAPNPVPAEMVHLAVMGAVRLEEDSTGKKPRPSLRLLDSSLPQHPLDQSMVGALFPGDQTVRRIPRSSAKFAKAMEKRVARGRSTARRNGWLTEERSRGAVAFAWTSIALFAATIAATVWSVAKDRELFGLSIFASIAAAVVVGVTCLAAFSRHTVLTHDGALRYEHLMGVAEFIRVAEADRLRMLQSYQGAERRRDGSVDVVHLYEKLLPYAMLLGEEDSWTRVLETQYPASGGGPDWMPIGVGMSISSRLSHYSTAMSGAATYTPPSTSSGGGGGSMGGGFSGGGGGGGFSGGR